MERQKLRVAPLELVFSGVRGEARDDAGVAVTNISNEAVQITQVRIVGDDAHSFALANLPGLPRYLAPEKSLDFTVAFAPTAEARVGVHHAVLQVLIGPREEHGPPVDVAALVTAGREGELEPPLAQVAQALGYHVNVGGETLSLGTNEEPIGDEVAASFFRSTKTGAIALDPVARFSPDEPLPYGYYRVDEGGQIEHKQIGVLAEGEHQQLNPGFHEGEGSISFDPGGEPFGIYVQSGTHTTYSDATLNQTKPPPRGKKRGKRRTPPAPERVAHALRVYPLKSRNGTPVPDAYLLAFEEARNGDYQDYVFILWNVKPVR